MIGETSTKQTCGRCIFDSDVPNIKFDDAGICSHCKLYDELDLQYPNQGPEGERLFGEMVETIRAGGRGKKYDCVVGVSGGCDSSYLLHMLVKAGLRPLAVHFDNTWNSPIATQNISRVVEKLGVELFTLVVDNNEYDDIYRSFMLSGVADIEAPTDIGIITTLYMAAEKYRVKYLIDGHSFRSEGVSPLGWLYMDGKYIASVHRQFGTLAMRTFPNLTLRRFLRWSALRGVTRMRPLYHLPYDKAAAKRMLAEEYGWEWYGGHHLENRFTAFYHSYFMPRRFGVDNRKNGFAALVRSGQMDRAEALAELQKPPHLEDDILDLVKKRLGFDDVEFEQVMRQPLRTWREFKTYKKTFERLRPLFYVLTKLGRVPESFYVKFCFPVEAMGHATLHREQPSHDEDVDRVNDGEQTGAEAELPAADAASRLSRKVLAK